MKVTLDLSKLREDGQISAEEYEKLLRLGKQGEGQFHLAAQGATASPLE